MDKALSILYFNFVTDVIPTEVGLHNHDADGFQVKAMYGMTKAEGDPYILFKY